MGDASGLASSSAAPIFSDSLLVLATPAYLAACVEARQRPCSQAQRRQLLTIVEKAILPGPEGHHNKVCKSHLTLAICRLGSKVCTSHLTLTLHPADHGCHWHRPQRHHHHALVLRPPPLRGAGRAVRQLAGLVKHLHRGPNLAANMAGAFQFIASIIALIIVVAPKDLLSKLEF
eukprot:1139055-Pelagomonas_calceolata.AAC.2